MKKVCTVYFNDKTTLCLGALMWDALIVTYSPWLYAENNKFIALPPSKMKKMSATRDTMFGQQGFTSTSM